MITRLLHRFTDAASSRRGKFVTIALWLVLAVVLVLLAPSLASVYNNSAQNIPADSRSEVASRLLLKEFPSSKGTPAILVFSDAKGLSSDDLARARQVSDWLTSDQKPALVGPVLSIFTVPQAASQLQSEDKTTMTMVATMTGESSSQTFQDSVKHIRDYLKQTTANTSLEAHVTGPAGVVADAVLIFSATDVSLLLGTVVLVLVLLILLYRSPILAFLPLIAVGWALQVVNACLGFAAHAGLFSVSQQASSIMTVLLFGAGTDYSIFVASRFREELQYTEDKYLAMRTTMRAVGEAITSSAGTVILSLLTLVFTAINLYNSLGLTLAIAVAIMLVAGLTLVPALLVWVGRAAYWPFVPRYTPEVARESDVKSLKGFWGRLGLWTAKHRILATVGSLLLLGILALGNIGSVPTFNLLTSFRNPTDATEGYAALQKHFPAGTLAPTTVLVKLKGDQADVYQHLTELDAVAVALQKSTGVAKVQGPTRPDGAQPIVDPAVLQKGLASLPESLKQAIRSGKFTQQPTSGPGPCQGPTCQPVNPQQVALIGAFAASSTYVSPDNSTAQFSVVLKDDPYSLDGINVIDPLRSALNQALHDNHLDADGYLSGQTAELADTYQYNLHDTYLIVPVVLILVAIVLGLLLRSLIAPLYLLGAVTLNFVASIGACAFFFQHIEGQDGFNYAIPLYTFIFLVALGADYTIFLMSRVREEAQRHNLEDGVPFAVSRTGGVITSAGLILAGTFAVLTTLPLNILYQLGVCVAVGILMDTFVVRGLLVPGVVLLLGKWNWWPGKLNSVVSEPESSHEEELMAEV
ncbi:MMPL family transporter [Tengunoibacter tsumagoiensis]|uniref:Membrane transport protein MMPL domain-containing protein n=1 Tax=Tengunoibacter tsumagoiensis TaxID=2014871 RepID=A0A402A1N0_9CHLR|nr:MMPL family transporter [Tengunoibacter tsumagoiensis]GCE12962.1 hypothetical protein KTT_28210 [Tengunoibacter tsumagoiensis]